MSIQQTITRYSSSTRTSDPVGNQKYSASLLSGNVSNLQSNNISTTSKKNFNTSSNDKHGILIDTKYYKVPKGSTKFIDNYCEQFISETTDMILRRDHVTFEKKRENLACASNIHAHFFPDCFFEEIRFMSKSLFKLQSGDSSLNVSSEEGKFKDSFSCSQDGFLAVLVYYMKKLEELKSDLGIFAQFEDLCVELFRLETKESSMDFFSDFYKIIITALGSCIKLMNFIFEKTGYIYPINLPSIHNAGAYYRTSLTRVLPKQCYLYLQKKKEVPYFELSKIEEFYEQLILSTTDESKKQEFKFKSETFQKFFPSSLLGEEIVIENNLVDMLFNLTTINDTTVKVNQVKNKEDTTKLFKTCSVLAKSMIVLMKNVLSELKLSLHNESSPLSDVSVLPLMEEVRFKMLILYGNPTFSNFENKLVCLKYYEPVKDITSNQRESLKRIAKELNALHRDNVVHCDLKPDHIVKDPLTSTGFRLLDFEFVVSEGDQVIGYTRGYQPPEYDCLEYHQSAIASKKSDIFSLGLCMLYFMDNKLSTPNRSVIPKHLSKIEDPLLRDILGRMLEFDGSKRFSDANDIIEALEISMDDTYQ